MIVSNYARWLHALRRGITQAHTHANIKPRLANSRARPGVKLSDIPRLSKTRSHFLKWQVWNEIGPAAPETSRSPQASLVAYSRHYELQSMQPQEAWISIVNIEIYANFLKKMMRQSQLARGPGHYSDELSP